MDLTIPAWLNNPLVVQVAILVVVIIIVSLGSSLLRSLIPRYVTDREAALRFRKFVSFVTYIVLIFFAINLFSNRLSQLTVVIGAIGAGIAFALQEVIGSIAGFIAISFGGFYRTGDRVQLGGIVGDVIDIGVLRTTLMEVGGWINADQYNGRTVRIANSFIFKEPVFNYSGSFPFVWDEIVMPVRYGSDRALARSIMQEVVEDVVGDYSERAKVAWKRMVRRFLIEDARIEPMVTLVATDNWLQYTARYVVDFKMRRATKDILFSRILDEFDATQGRVQTASTTIELVAWPNVVMGGAGHPPTPIQPRMNTEQPNE